ELCTVGNFMQPHQYLYSGSNLGPNQYFGCVDRNRDDFKVDPITELIFIDAATDAPKMCSSMGGSIGLAYYDSKYVCMLRTPPLADGPMTVVEDLRFAWYDRAPANLSNACAA